MGLVSSKEPGEGIGAGKQRQKKCYNFVLAHSALEAACCGSAGRFPNIVLLGVVDMIFTGFIRGAFTVIHNPAPKLK
jgi:hypothetical protein